MLTGKRILIVEDSRTIKFLVKTLLEKEGAIVTEAGSEWGLFNKIEEYGVLADLIIMDLVLNQENGLDLIQKLKETPKYSAIPIIILTENAQIESILKARSLGVKSYLKKPFVKEELIKRIDDAFGVENNNTP